MRVLGMKNWMFITFAIMFLATAYAAMSDIVGDVDVGYLNPRDEWMRDATVPLNFTILGNSSLYDCEIATNYTGLMAVAGNVTVLNNTATLFPLAFNESIDLDFGWNMTCSGNGGETFSNSTIAIFGVDYTAPTGVTVYPGSGDNVTVNAGTNYTNANYSLDYSFNWSTNDTNTVNCTLWTNFTGTWQEENTTNNMNHYSGDLLWLNFTNMTEGGTQGGPLDGFYAWDLVCNDLAMNNYSLAYPSDYFGIVVDTVLPAEFNLSGPSNSTYSTNSSPVFEWQWASDDWFERYFLEWSVSESFNDSSTNIYSSTENYSVMNLAQNTRYFWRVKAYDLGGNDQNASAYGIEDSGASVREYWQYITDNVAPVVALVSPENGSYVDGEDAVDFVFNVTETNPSHCTLYFGNESDYFANETGEFLSNISSGANMVFENKSNLNSSNVTAMWTVECWDNAGNSANASEIWDFAIEKGTLTAPNVSVDDYYSYWTRKAAVIAPNFTFMPTDAIWFSHYAILADNDTDFSSPEVDINITDSGNTTVYVDLSELADQGVYLNISACSLSGKCVYGNTTTTTANYTHHSVCSTLYTGWNACMVTDNRGASLAEIGYETGATFVSFLSYENRTFLTHVVGSTTYDGLVLNYSETYFVYMNASANRTFGWIDVNETLVDRADDVVGNIFGLYEVNITNTSNGAWNIVGILNDTTTLGNIVRAANLGSANPGAFANSNLTMFSLVNMSSNGLTFVPMVWNYSVNNATTVRYGQAIWVYYDSSLVASALYGSIWNRTVG